MKKNQYLYEIMQMRPTQVGFIVFILILTFLFPFRLLAVALTVGENNLSNDYLGFTRPIIHIANNPFYFGDLKDTCFKSQCEPLTYLLMGWGAQYFDWNVRIEIAFSALVALATVFLVYFSIVGVSFSSKKTWLLVFLSAFSFSFTLMSTYTFGQAAIYTTLAFLGLSLGIFAVKIYPNSLMGFFILVIGMWISASSYGGGLFAIPILFLGLLIGFRKIRYYFWWFLSVLIIGIPYLQFFSQSDSPGGKLNIISFFRFEWIFRLLGLFFSNELWFSYPGKQPLFTSSPIIYGVTGFIVLCLGLFFVFYYYGIRRIAFFYSELALILFGLGPVWLVSLLREGIAPWYVSNTLPFWIGLLGLFYSLFFKERLIDVLVSKLVRMFALVLLLIVSILFVHSNITYQDKIFHLVTRAPSSASCLRHSSTAPTYCEPFLFQWGLGNPQLIDRLGRPLQENGLSVYASEQEWTLQGDYLFDTTEVLPSLQGVNPYWVDAKNNITNWGDYHRLNLVLPSNSEIKWIVQLPDQIETAKFETGLGILWQESLHDNHDNAHWIFQVKVTDEYKKDHLYKYELAGKDFAGNTNFLAETISLHKFSGQRITISLNTIKNDATTGDIILQMPRILVNNKNHPLDKTTSYQPENVLNSEIPASFVQLWLPIGKEDENILVDNIKYDKHNFYKESGDAYIRFENEDGYCVYNSTNLYITISMDETTSYRYGTFLLKIKDLDGGTAFAQFILPYLEDSDQHTYIYPLKLHIATSPSYLQSIEIRPLGSPGAASFRIENIGLFDQENDLTQCLLLPK